MHDFEWDAAKAKRNLQKHGIDFDDACGIFDGAIVERLDTRMDYGEDRLIAVGMVDGVELTIVYTWRNNVRRLISARKADANERQNYHQALRRESETGKD